MINNFEDYENVNWNIYCFSCGNYVSFSRWNKFHDKCDYCISEGEEKE